MQHFWSSLLAESTHFRHLNSSSMQQIVPSLEHPQHSGILQYNDEMLQHIAATGTKSPTLVPPSSFWGGAAIVEYGVLKLQV